MAVKTRLLSRCRDILRYAERTPLVRRYAGLASELPGGAIRGGLNASQCARRRPSHSGWFIATRRGCGGSQGGAGGVHIPW